MTTIITDHGSGRQTSEIRRLALVTHSAAAPHRSLAEHLENARLGSASLALATASMRNGSGTRRRLCLMAAILSMIDQPTNATSSVGPLSRGHSASARTVIGEFDPRIVLRILSIPRIVVVCTYPRTTHPAAARFVDLERLFAVFQIAVPSQECWRTRFLDDDLSSPRTMPISKNREYDPHESRI